MNILCKGITLSGRKCRRKLRNRSFCSDHDPINIRTRYRQAKPRECVVCCESLSNQPRALECGHWVHINCIIHSAKAECPICRTRLNLSNHINKRIETIAKKRKEETIREEQEEIQSDLQLHLAGLIAPALQERIHEVIGDLIDEDELFDEDAYQGFLHSLINYELFSDDF